MFPILNLWGIGMNAKGIKKVTIVDVAKEAGVSISTVSRVLNQNTPVAEETAQRVWEVIERLQFNPNAAARKLASKRTNTIGLIVPMIGGTFFPLMFSGIERGVNEGGFELLVYVSPCHPVPHRPLTPPVGPQNTDGLIVFTEGMSDEDLRALHVKGFPIVLLHRTSPKDCEIPYVTVENRLGTEKLIDHLIEVHGYTRIGFLRGPATNEESYEREQGFRASLQKHGLQPDEALFGIGNFHPETAAESVRQMLSSRKRPQAIFTGDDASAAAVMKALLEMGVSIPDEIAIVGFDDDYLAPYLPLPLTTVHSPIEQAGYTAAQLLIQQIRGEAVQSQVLPTHLVIRRSCGCITSHPS